MKLINREREGGRKPTKSWRVLTEDSHLQLNREGRAKEKKTRKLRVIVQEKEGMKGVRCI